MNKTERQFLRRLRDAQPDGLPRSSLPKSCDDLIQLLRNCGAVEFKPAKRGRGVVLRINNATAFNRLAARHFPEGLDANIDAISAPWHPRLSWVRNLDERSFEQHAAFLNRVQEGLVEGWFETPVPIKYRSLQLTGNEKEVERLSKTCLFEPGRLSLELLGCYVPIRPMATYRISDDPSILIFENADSFAVARDVLSGLREPPYGRLGYGGGGRVTNSLRFLITLDVPFERLEYVGDLDVHGLNIALQARAAAETCGLPRLQPAPGIHRAMLKSAARFGHPDGWPVPEDRRSDTGADSVLSFFPEGIETDVRRILKAGHRIPEEVLGPGELAQLWAE